MFGLYSEDQAISVMLMGYELGLSLTASFEFIHLIQNKPSLSPKGALAIILASNDLELFDVKDEANKCTVTMKRRSNGFSYTTSWSIDDAKAAGLVKPDGNWVKYPRNMCRWRAIGFCADIVFPDLLGGMSRTDEIGGDIDAIDGEYREVKDFYTELSEAIDKHGAEAIIAGNDGKIPESFDQLNAAIRKVASVY